jgi:hypothetical protein
MARILEVDQMWSEDRRADFMLARWLDPKFGPRRDEDRDFLLRLAHGARNTLLRIEAIQRFNDVDSVALLIPLLDDPNPEIVLETVRVIKPYRYHPRWRHKNVPTAIWNEHGGIENLEEIKRAWKSG